MEDEINIRIINISEILNYIVSFVEKNDKVFLLDIQKALFEHFDHKFSLASIKKYVKRLYKKQKIYIMRDITTDNKCKYIILSKKEFEKQKAKAINEFLNEKPFNQHYLFFCSFGFLEREAEELFNETTLNLKNGHKSNIKEV